MRLTENDIKQYLRLGYFYPVTAFGKQSTSNLLQLALKLYERSQKLIIKNPHLDNVDFLNVIKNSNIVNCVSQLLGDVLYIENTFLIFKLPNTDFEVPLHQDGINPNLELDSNNSLTTWISITNSNIKNGGLIIYPKSHMDGYFNYETNNTFAKRAGSTYSIFTEINYDMLNLELEAGQSVIINSKLIHESKSNRSGELRCGLNIRWVNNTGIIKRVNNSNNLIQIK